MLFSRRKKKKKRKIKLKIIDVGTNILIERKFTHIK